VLLCPHSPVLSSSLSSADLFPRAQNITWISSNFKTVLTWGPKPTADYSYTVEFQQVGKDHRRNPHCIRSSQTECDLTNTMSDLRACYTADVISEPPMGVPKEPQEYPHSSSPRFCPYTDSDKNSKRLMTVTVHVTDPLTAAFQDGRQLSIRDVFGEELEYKVIYKKNKSTGKKTAKSNSNAVEVTRLDRGESYCFQVQAVVRSRPTSTQEGELSQTQCTHQQNPSLLDNYSVGVIAGAILLPLLLVGGLIAVVVICCRRRSKKQRNEKEKEAEALNV
uniref:Tissue factor n=1 Tax=Periophthalmus magnuspinnatus TaxID=409849 RepID=A0A3B3ZVA8_9GOBI